MQVVCISRAFGADGEEVGRLVAERLGFVYVDEEIVVRAAKKANVTPEVVAAVEERRSLALRLLEGLAAAGAPGYGAPLYAADAGWSGAGDVYRSLIRQVIDEAAARGDVVIVAHAASMALAGRDPLLRVLVTGGPEARARRVADAQGLDVSKANKVIKDSDKARASYLKEFYGIDSEQPVHYDVVINTDTLSPEQAATVLVEAARLRGAPGTPDPSG